MNERFANASDARLEDFIVDTQGIENLARATASPRSTPMRAGAYHADGSRSIAHWLQTRLCQSWVTATEEVRVARALHTQPELAAVFRARRAQLGPAQARYPPRSGPRGPARRRIRPPHISRCPRAPGQPHAERHHGPSPQQAHDERSLQRRVLPGGRLEGLRCRLPVEDAAAVFKSLDRFASGLPSNPQTGKPDPYPQRMADALVSLCKVSLAQQSDADRSTIVVHTALDSLRGLRHDLSELDTGTQVAGETVRRLCCSGRVEFCIVTKTGQTIGIRRASRVVPPSILRQLWYRDGGCRLCGRVRCVEATTSSSGRSVRRTSTTRDVNSRT